MKDDDGAATASYARDGWYASGGLIPHDVVDRAATTVREVHSRAPDRQLPARLGAFLRWPPGTRRPERLNQYIALQYESIFRLATYPALVRMAGVLTGASRLRLFNTALIVKPPGSESRYAQVGWHCDQTYWPTCSSPRMITAWVPLQDTTVAMGTLRVINGSHRWPPDDNLAALREVRAFVSDDHDSLRRRLEELGHPLEVSTIELRKGEVSFHHPLTYHSSGVNRGDRIRAAISVHLQDGDNRYRPSIGGNGRGYVHDGLVRSLPNGDPDYADSEICPVVWPVAEGKDTGSG